MTNNANTLSSLGDQARDSDQFDVPIYGPIAAQNIATSSLPETVADSYTWFANEAFWSKECGKDFGRPQVGDDKDPNCNNDTCEDDDSSSDGGSGGA